MKKAKLVLTLNKETVVNLDNTDMNRIKGGGEIYSGKRSCIDMSNCPICRSIEFTCRCN